MLVFKRVCGVAWQGFVCLACNALQFALHEYSKFAVGRRNAFISSFPLVSFSSPARVPFFSSIVLLALDQTPSVLALVVLVAFDHSDHEMISPIRVIAHGACVVFMR